MINESTNGFSYESRAILNNNTSVFVRLSVFIV